MDFALFFVLNLLRVLETALLLRVILSWFSPGATHGVYGFLKSATDPMLRPIQALLPGTGMIDFSPLVAFLLLQAAEHGVTRLFA